MAPFPIDFGKMCFALERINKLKFALKLKIRDNVVVDQNTANIRAKLCASCHNNVSQLVARSGCFIAEKDVFDQVSKEIVKDRTTPHDKQLQSCNVCAGDNKISVWLFNYYNMNRQDKNAFPSFCWKKDLQ